MSMAGLLVLGAAAPAAETGVLENEFLRIEIGGRPAPAIERIIHKRSGREIVAGSKGVGLFSMIATKVPRNHPSMFLAAPRPFDSRGCGCLGYRSK